MRLRAMLPRVTITSGKNRPKLRRDYTEMVIRWGRLFASLDMDARGFGLDVAVRNTDRFVNLYVDKPTGKIDLSIGYKKEV